MSSDAPRLTRKAGERLARYRWHLRRIIRDYHRSPPTHRQMSASRPAPTIRVRYGD